MVEVTVGGKDGIGGSGVMMEVMVGGNNSLSGRAGDMCGRSSFQNPVLRFLTAGRSLVPTDLLRAYHVPGPVGLTSFPQCTDIAVLTDKTLSSDRTSDLATSSQLVRHGKVLKPWVLDL